MNAFNPDAERALLNSLVVDYRDESPYSEIKKNVIMALVDAHIAQGPSKSGLQLGCANGYETRQLAGKLKQLTVVDGSTLFVERMSARNERDNVKYVASLFEDLRYPGHAERYDYVFCNYVLEHVFDTQVILQNIKSLLKPDGKAFIVVPNCFALSRQIALQMGLLERLEDLTDNDLRHGHRRVYALESLVQDVTRAGLSVQATSGVILKILADFQLNKLLGDGFLTSEHIVAMQKVAEQSDETARLSDSLFVVATH